MSETVKNTGESNHGVKTGWEEMEVMPKHMKKDVPEKPKNVDYRPKHMKEVIDSQPIEEERVSSEEAAPQLSEKDQARLEAWQATIRQLREKRGPLSELKEEKAFRPEDLGLTAKEVIEEQPGLMIVQDIEDGDSKFWVRSADRGGEPSETTVNRELERYREQIMDAKDGVELSKAARIESNVRFALGDNEDVMKQFRKVAEEAGYREKQEQFSGDPAKFEKKNTAVAVADMRKQVAAMEKDLNDIEGHLQNCRGIRGLFGEKRREKSQLKWQYGQAKRRLERGREDLAQLEERARNLGEAQDKADLKVVEGGGKIGSEADGDSELKKAA